MRGETRASFTFDWQKSGTALFLGPGRLPRRRVCAGAQPHAQGSQPVRAGLASLNTATRACYTQLQTVGSGC